jgi:hypothetical protein
MTTTTKRKGNGRSRRNLLLDIGLAFLFVIAMEVYFTGVPLHEWLGLLFTMLFGIHIIWHWQWIVGVTRTFFKKLLHESRLNYVLNAALLVDMLVLTVTGIVISHSLGFELSLSSSASLSWVTLHALSAELSLILIALHIALHWRWILTNTRKYLFPQSKKGQQRQGANSLSPAAMPINRRESHE